MEEKSRKSKEKNGIEGTQHREHSCYAVADDDGENVIRKSGFKDDGCRCMCVLVRVGVEMSGRWEMCGTCDCKVMVKMKPPL